MTSCVTWWSAGTRRRSRSASRVGTRRDRNCFATVTPLRCGRCRSSSRRPRCGGPAGGTRALGREEDRAGLRRGARGEKVKRGRRVPAPDREVLRRLRAGCPVVGHASVTTRSRQRGNRATPSCRWPSRRRRRPSCNCTSRRRRRLHPGRRRVEEDRLESRVAAGEKVNDGSGAPFGGRIAPAG